MKKPLTPLKMLLILALLLSGIAVSAQQNGISDLRAYSGSPNSLAFSPDGMLLATGDQASGVRVWDFVTGEALFDFFGHRSWVTSVAFSPDSTWLASGGRDREIRTWRITNGNPGLVLRHHQDTVTDMAFMPDGTSLISGSQDGIVWMGNIESGIATRTWEMGQPIHALALSPDASILAVGLADGTIRLIALGEDRIAPVGQPILPEVTLTGHDGAVTDLAFAPNRQLLASSGMDGTVHQWDLRNAFSGGFTPVIVMPGGDMPMMSLAMGLDGGTIAVGLDGEIHQWNINGELERVVPHGAPLTQLAFHPQSTILAIVDSDSRVDIHEIEMGETNVVGAATSVIVRPAPFRTITLLNEGTPQSRTIANNATAMTIPSVDIYSDLTTFFLDGISWGIDPYEQNVGHLEGTAFLGPTGNTVLGGHAEYPTGAPGIFYHLYDVALGDQVFVQSGDTEKRYVITDIKTVQFDDLSVVYPTEDSRVTLITCNIPTYNSVRQGYDERLIVIAKEVSGVG